MAKPASSSKKDLIVCADYEEEEESGWTSYFEDFSSNTNSSCFSLCDGDGSSSLVSDAASCAACKFSHHHNHHLLLSSLSSNDFGVPPNLPDMKLRFKKSRANQILEDDPLADTATSPLNSPKDGDLNPTAMISRKKADDHDPCADSTGKGFTSEHISDTKRDEVQSKDEKNTKGTNRMNYTELNKRGLSLFPFSMLVNYFG